MPLPVIAATFRCSYVFLAGTGQESVNVLHHRFIGTEAELAAAIDAALVAIHGSNNPWGALSDAYSLNHIEILALDGASAGIAMTPSVSYIGGGGGNQVTEQALIVRFKTDTRGPQGRGRCFIGPLGEGQVDNGHMSPSFCDAVNANWIGYIDALSAQSVEMVVASYTHAIARPVTSTFVPTKVGLQVRRLRRI